MQIVAIIIIVDLSDLMFLISAACAGAADLA